MLPLLLCVEAVKHGDVQYGKLSEDIFNDSRDLKQILLQ